ncbi:hypothetical protein T492DRAFT_996829 [Pavlovales sp. CCMP2436]|nr:hypothetical protein T492DRAFT_996829 [Pavlovales sp. CCMP2436]
MGATMANNGVTCAKIFYDDDYEPYSPCYNGPSNSATCYFQRMKWTTTCGSSSDDDYQRVCWCESSSSEPEPEPGPEPVPGGFFVGDEGASCDATCTAAGGTCGEESLKKTEALNAASTVATMADNGVTCVGIKQATFDDYAPSFYNDADHATCYFQGMKWLTTCGALPVRGKQILQRLCWCGMPPPPSPPSPALLVAGETCTCHGNGRRGRALLFGSFVLLPPHPADQCD